MKVYATDSIRNVCLVGSQSDGKTSIAEALLFNAKVTTRLGTITEGNTVCDYSPEEIERKISVHLSDTFFEHKDNKINLLVTPGYGDFIGEVYAGLAVAETAVFTVSGDSGLTPVGENLWEVLEEKKNPVVIFLNKLDKDNINFEELIKSLKEKLSAQIAVINVPNATGQGFSAVKNIIDAGAKDSWYDGLLETVSSSDDKLTEEYLEGKEITLDEMKSTLKKAIKERKVFPLLCGSATKNIGIKELADFVVDYLPSPKPAIDNAHFSGLVYKTINEPGMGQINFVKVYSGALAHGKDIKNFTKNTTERIGQICFVQGKKKVDTAAVSVGDLVALLKLKETRTDDVLCDEKFQPDIKQVVFPEPICDLEVMVPDQYMGAVMGDLNSRRGRVMGMDKPGKKEIIKAQVPMSEIFEYATDLRSLTKGSGKFSMRFSHYEDAPPQIAQPLIDLYTKTREAESEK